MKAPNKTNAWFSVGLLLALTAGSPAIADDTELLLVNPVYDPDAIQANIMLIVDSSGSMRSNASTRQVYDSTATYNGSCESNRLYWSDIDAPPACTDNMRFIDKNAFLCAAANRQLEGVGSYAGSLAQYRVDDTGADKWQLLLSGNNADPVECQEDSGEHGADDTSTAVYAMTGSNGSTYTSDSSLEIAWGSYPTSDTYTIYDGNYLNWKENPVYVNRPRIDIVKDAITNVLDSITRVNVGIMVFNQLEGGTVIQGLTNLENNRADIRNTITGVIADGWTPLSETMYEAALYWQGLSAHYGDARTDSAAFVSADSTIYAAPNTPVCTKNYNILLTDGEPTEDLGALALAPTLPGFASRLGRAACTGAGHGACLDDIAQYMSIPDLVSNQEGDQYVTTHTIGFTIDLPILKETANLSGGNYYLADDQENLTRALLKIFGDATERSLSFTAPAVAVNAFNRTQNLNDLYMTVFQAKPKAHWPGNIKKYTIANRQIVDANGLSAVDPATGFFRDEAESYWTVGGPDGAKVELGGAANMLPNPATRKMYTNNGSDSSLTAASNAVSPVNAGAFALADLGLTGSAAEPTADELIRWARGEDTRDEDLDPSTLVRNVIGDPLHSQPAAVVYGGSGDSADVVVYAATNDGYLHAIDGATGEELWAFLPKELMPGLAKLYFNPDSKYKHYGIDSDIVPVVVDRDNNGIIDGSDFVYIVFGLRRGGNDYYALDVTSKTQPRLLWKASYPGMGQTWSAPVIARVDINDGGLNDDKAVVVVGGGYDSVHDVASHPVNPDTLGAGIFMLDLVSGEKLWQASRSTGNLRLSNMTRAIPSQIKVIDMNGDRLADRMYAADLGGQLWRFDITNGESPNTLVAGGVIARLGAEGLGAPTGADTRRFYNSPDASLFTDTTQNRRYLAISIGSGYRAHPLDNQASDRFYSIRDSKVFTALTQAEYDSYPIVTESDLIEVSDRVNVALTPDDRGWKFTLPPTQKILADSVTFDNSVFFVGFSPDVRAATACEAKVGRNFLYRMSLINGDPVVNNLATVTDDTADAARRIELAQGGIAPSPTFLFPGATDPDCTGTECSQPPLGCVGVECFEPGFANRPVRTLWTQDGIQ